MYKMNNILYKINYHWKVLGFSEVFYIHQGLRYNQKYSKNSNIKKYYFQLKITVFYFNIFSNVNFSCEAKLKFQHHYSSPVSHDLSEIILICWFAAQDTFLIIINDETSYAA